jgi:hypothetical protein
MKEMKRDPWPITSILRWVPRKKVMCQNCTFIPSSFGNITRVNFNGSFSDSKVDPSKSFVARSPPQSLEEEDWILHRTNIGTTWWQRRSDRTMMSVHTTSRLWTHVCRLMIRNATNGVPTISEKARGKLISISHQRKNGETLGWWWQR